MKLLPSAYGVRREVITARIRRMTEGNFFTLSTIAGGGGGGYHHLVDGGYPFPGPGGEGTPFPGPGGHYLPKWRVGVLSSQVGGTTFPRWGGGVPLLEQHSMYLLCGRQYASCVHAGGLSCVFTGVCLLPESGPRSLLGNPVSGPMSLLGEGDTQVFGPMSPLGKEGRGTQIGTVVSPRQNMGTPIQDRATPWTGEWW